VSLCRDPWPVPIYAAKAKGSKAKGGQTLSLTQ